MSVLVGRTEGFVAILAMSGITDCQGMSPTMDSIYNRSLGKSIAWEYIRCGMPNVSTSLFDTTAFLEVFNRF